MQRKKRKEKGKKCLKTFYQIFIWIIPEIMSSHTIIDNQAQNIIKCSSHEVTGIKFCHLHLSAMSVNLRGSVQVL